MSKRKHGKPRCRVAGRKPRPVVVVRQSDYAPRSSKPKSAEHPLTAAFQAGRIDYEQFKAGDNLRNLCETLGGSGKDSTNLERSGSGTGTSFSLAQANAGREIRKIRERLGGARSANWIICHAFCGEGYSMRDAIRMAKIPCHANGVVSRVQEALDALCGRKKRTKPVHAAAPAPKRYWKQLACAGCRQAIPEATQPSAVGEWKGRPFQLCGPCAEKEPKLIAEIGAAELNDRYRANLWLPPAPDETATQRARPQKVAA